MTRSTQKIKIAMHTRYYWGKSVTKTKHQQLLQLVTVIADCWILEKKYIIVKSVRPFKVIGRKIWRRFTLMNETILIISKPGINDPELIFSLVWTNSYIPRYVMCNSVGIFVGNSKALQTSLSMCSAIIMHTVACKIIRVIYCRWSQRKGTPFVCA